VAQPAYRRILLKLSGEILAGAGGYVLDWSALESITRQIKKAHDMGCEIGIVVGAGNIFRGRDAVGHGVDPPSADTIGMLATTINALSLQARFEAAGLHTRVLSAIRMEQVCEPYIRRRAIRHLEKGRVVIFSAGTGNPYFTTDTAAVLRAVEIHSEVVLKGTRVDGIFSEDPEINPKAAFFKDITFQEALERQLRIMDLTALTLCMENGLPLVVFNIKNEGNLERLLLGERVGTLVRRQREGEKGT